MGYGHAPVQGSFIEISVDISTKSNILDTHIIQRQRKLILEKGGLSKEINKYLDQIQISVEKGDEEIELLLN